MCVGNDDDVRSVALGAEGVVAGLWPGAVLIDHTTASAGLAEELAAAAAVRRMGGVGSGQLTKMVNQVCIAGVLQGPAEGLPPFRGSAGRLRGERTAGWVRAASGALERHVRNRAGLRLSRYSEPATWKQ